MPVEFENQVELSFSDDKWHLVAPFEDKSTPLTAKNKSNTAISVYCSSNPTLTEKNLDDYLSSNEIDPIEIGGVFYEVSSKTGEKMFVKCTEGKGKVAIRIFGTMDPMEDITVLSSVLSETIIRLDTHIATKSGNPHGVTKADVGLGNIPNAITSDPLDKRWDTAHENEVLPTLGALRDVRAYAGAHIEITSGNPHGVTKTHVGLSNVANYPPATALQALDITNNQVYMTPYTTNELIKDIVVVANSMKPQCVIAGNIINRPQGWTMKDISSPTVLITRVDNHTAVIKSGLQVSFAYRGMCRVSKILTENISCVFADMVPNGIQYLYVDLDEKGNISNWGSTPSAPIVGVGIETAYDGDYYNYAQCEVRHVNGDEVKRVYIGKIYFSNNEIVDIVSVPLGDEVIIPVQTSISLGQSALLNNPFIAPVETKALVEYNGKWGESCWNDQTGVLAHPRPGYEQDQIVVQVGSVGYLTRGSSSGTGFGSEFLTVTSPLRTTIKVTRPH